MKFHPRRKRIIERKLIASWNLLILLAALYGCLFAISKIHSAHFSVAANEPMLADSITATTTATLKLVVTPEPSPAVQPEEKAPESIEDIVRRVFGKNASAALAVMRCESSGVPTKVGDKGLMSINQQTGERIGDSIGLFQIRTGSHNWNRALENGMTAYEFRTALMDPEYNIKYAKRMYDAQGWTPWANCKRKLGL